MRSPTILAIETSCDETGVAVVQRQGNAIRVLASTLASQVDIHQQTGGVVPEVAAREHASVIQPLIKKVLKGVRPPNPKGSDPFIDAIAVTVGPGLAPALSVGVTAAQALAYAWDKPIVPVHHLEGHIYSALCASNALNQKETSNTALPSASPDKGRLGGVTAVPEPFPALALIVSGGHTQLVHVPAHITYEVIGATRDDAAGEAFDKVARLLGLPYPGGPQISRLAEQGNPAAFTFARPMINSGDLDFSFSGLKTEVLYTLRDLARGATTKPSPHQACPPFWRVRGRSRGGDQAANLAASFEQAVVDTLIAKTRVALERFRPRALLAAGGVLANKKLRHALATLTQDTDVELRLAPLSLCGDNAVMIGQAALFAHTAGRTASWQDIDAVARLPLDTSIAAPYRAP